MGDVSCGPLRIPLAGELGPDNRGNGAAPHAAPFRWEAHPLAWVVVLVFVVILARKAVTA